MLDGGEVFGCLICAHPTVVVAKYNIKNPVEAALYTQWERTAFANVGASLSNDVINSSPLVHCLAIRYRAVGSR